MISFLQKIRKKLDMNWLSILLVLNLSFLSFIATFRGFFAFFDLLGKDLSRDWYVPLTLTFVVQAAILMSVWQIKGSPWHKKPLWMVIYAFCVIFSVGFGYAFWFDRMRADELSKELSSDTLLAVTSPITSYVDQFNRLGDEMADIAAYSLNKSEEEAAQGGTCHPGVPLGYGPMARYRATDAELFVALNKEVQKTINELESILKKSVPVDIANRPVSEQETALKAAIKHIRVTFDPEALRQRILSAVDQQIKKAKETITSIVNGSRKQVPLCAPDAQEKITFHNRLVNLQFQDLAQESEVVLLDATNKKTVLNYAFGSILYRVFSLVGLKFGSEAIAKRKYKSKIDDWIPLFLGLVVDLLIMLFSVRQNPQMRHASTILKQLDDNVVPELMGHLHDQFPNMTAQQIDEIMAKHKMIVSIPGWGNQAQFIVRENESTSDAIGVRNFMDSMIHSRLAKVKRNRKYRQLPKAFQTKITKGIHHSKMQREWLTDYYSVYRIDDRLLWEIMTVLRREIASTTT